MLHVPNQFRVQSGPFASDETYGNNGAFVIPFPGTRYKLSVICSDGAGWDHVSVSLTNRCPNWEEMCFIKNLFWDDEDVVVQFHPKKSEYVNVHNYCLHMWKQQGVEITTPPKIMVG